MLLPRATISDLPIRIRRRDRAAAAALTVAFLFAPGSAQSATPGTAPTQDAAPAARTITVFDQAEIAYEGPDPQQEDQDGFVLRHAGQTVERTLDLPDSLMDASVNELAAARITLVVEVEPVLGAENMPNDPWTRLGVIALALDAPPGRLRVNEVELMRFATGYGGASRFEEDVTALAPLLRGRRTLRAFISTYGGKPGWRITVQLRYEPGRAGARRPALARPLFNSPHVTRRAPVVQGRVTIPPGFDRPRIRILSTGHATDGEAENEFATCSHVLRVDNRIVAQWRPWREGSTATRNVNPWSGRRMIDGRELRSSDLDRAGWTPGTAVIPLIIPVDELGPGPHEVTLSIEGIRGSTEEGGPHGYFAVSAVVVADAPWPASDTP